MTSQEKKQKIINLFITKIDTAIANNNLNYSVDYKQEISKLYNLDEIINYACQVWANIHSGLEENQLPPLLGEAESNEMRRLTFDYLTELEQEISAKQQLINNLPAKTEGLENNPLPAYDEEATQLNHKINDLNFQIQGLEGELKQAKQRERERERERTDSNPSRETQNRDPQDNPPTTKIKWQHQWKYN